MRWRIRRDDVSQDSRVARRLPVPQCRISARPAAGDRRRFQLRIVIARGFADLVTPYFATQLILDQIPQPGLNPFAQYSNAWIIPRLHVAVAAAMITAAQIGRNPT
jgi:hypothetical protein